MNGLGWWRCGSPRGLAGAGGGRGGRPSAGLAVVGLVAVLALDDLRFYYIESTRTSDFGGDNGMVAQRLAEHLRYEPASAHVAFFGTPRMGYYSIPSLQYLVPQIAG